MRLQLLICGRVVTVKALRGYGVPNTRNTAWGSGTQN